MSTKLSSELTTPHIADAAVRLGIDPRAPVGIFAQTDRARSGLTYGPVRPVRHHGSADIFLEAMNECRLGDVLAIDNGGLLGEGCIGDLIAGEAVNAGIAGVVIWGAHRDTPILNRMNVSVFSLGSYPFGPTSVRSRSDDSLARANFSSFDVTADDFVFADMDGVVFVPAREVDEITRIADEIRQTELRQVEAMAHSNLRTQLQFDHFLAQREQDPALTFREHLRRIGGAIEE